MNGQLYHYRVRGVNRDNVSVWSAQARARPYVQVWHPTNLRGRGYDDGRIVLTWHVGRNALDYEIYQWDGRSGRWRTLPFTETGPGFEATYSVYISGNLATVSGLPTGVAYSHDMRGKNGLNYSRYWSNIADTWVPR